jgi:hypothetical protein
MAVTGGGEAVVRAVAVTGRGIAAGGGADRALAAIHVGRSPCGRSVDLQTHENTRGNMRTSILTLAAVAAAALAFGKADAMPLGGLGSAADSLGLVEKSQYFYDGRNYCWYPDGWHGPGFYWCGYAWRSGFGWGGPIGWRGWHGGGGRAFVGPRGGVGVVGPRGGRALSAPVAGAPSSARRRARLCRPAHGRRRRRRSHAWRWWRWWRRPHGRWWWWRRTPPLITNERRAAFRAALFL